MLVKIEHQKVLDFLNEHKVDSKQINLFKGQFDNFFSKRNIYQVRYNKIRGVITIISDNEEFNSAYLTQIVDNVDEADLPHNWFIRILNTEKDNFILFTDFAGT